MVQKITIFLLSLGIFLGPLHAGTGFSKISAAEQAKKLKDKQRKEVIELAARIFPVKELLPIIYAYARSFQLTLANKHKISKYQESVEALVACSDGSLLCQSIAPTFDSAAYGRKGVLRRLNPATSDVEGLRQWPILHGTHSSLALLPNRSFCTDDATLLEIPGAPSGNIVYRPIHADAITTLLVLKNGNLLSASCDAKIKEWTLAQQPNPDGEFLNRVRTYRGHAQAVHSLAQLANGNFVSGSNDGILIEWAPGTGQPARMFLPRVGQPTLFKYLDVFPNGNLVSAGQSDIATLNTQKERIELEQVFNSQSEITSLAVLNDTHFVSSSDKGDMLLWHVESPEPVQKLKNCVKSITSLARTGNKLFVGSHDGCVGEWIDDDRSALESALESTKKQATPFTASTMAAPKP